MQPKTVAESQVVMSQMMQPSDANPSGNVHGGAILKLMDNAAGSAAMRHSRCRVVTVAIDNVSFHAPAYIGDLVTLKASVNSTGYTSMEVGVRVEAENLITGQVVHTSSAYLVYVALDAHGQPTPVAPVIAETDEEKRRMREAAVRRETRLQIAKSKTKQQGERA